MCAPDEFYGRRVANTDASHGWIFFIDNARLFGEEQFPETAFSKDYDGED